MYVPDTRTVNREWLHANFPCMQACPVHTEAGRYVALIAEGRYEEAYRVARRPNPFASLCGRICAAPCEDACRRGTIDAPIAIRALKRFVCEQYGVESMLDLDRIHRALSGRLRESGHWVAIIGAGPAGLAAAHDLALLGHRVTVFEKQSVAGGMLVLGIPEYRLPRELIRLEINAILQLGVELQLNKAVGRDFTLDDLLDNGYQAVFMATGAHRSRTLDIPGADGPGVHNALEFLLDVNLGERVNLGKKILVIGGGNVAFDVARTAAREAQKDTKPASDIVSALDVARSAVRFGGKEVEVVCLEARHEMPAKREEIEDAEEERIRVHHRLGPVRILRQNGHVSGLEVAEVASVFDADGRFNPRLTPGTERCLEADTIIVAIGQQPDVSYVQEHHAIRVNPNQTIAIDVETMASSRSGVFAGGDVAFGARNVIHAIADGKRAARHIHAYLQKSEASSESSISLLDIDPAQYQPVHAYDRLPRQSVPMLPVSRRTGIAQVELGYTPTQAQLEASRCLRCWMNTQFYGNESNGTECVLCGGCVDICPEGCLELLPVEAMDDGNISPELTEVAWMGTSHGTGQQLSGGAVMLKDETRCIRCGLCAQRCPVSCITLESYFEQKGNMA